MKNLIASSALAFLCATTISTAAFSAQPNLTPNMSFAHPAFTLIASKQQCLNKCINWNNQCQNIVTNQGDKSGWNNATRTAAYRQECAPHVDACQNRCGPFGPGECRILDGEQVCS